MEDISWQALIKPNRTGLSMIATYWRQASGPHSVHFTKIRTQNCITNNLRQSNSVLVLNSRNMTQDACHHHPAVAAKDQNHCRTVSTQPYRKSGTWRPWSFGSSSQQFDGRRINHFSFKLAIHQPRNIVGSDRSSLCCSAPFYV